MTTATEVVRDLRERGELWVAAPGLVGLRGETAGLMRRLEACLGSLARATGAGDLRPPPALGFETLRRADYFESFPHWLTAAAHLGGDTEALERVARAADPCAVARRSLQPAEAALSPALCYHAYALYAGRALESPPLLLTTQGSCWRREPSFAPLERGWAFTMREIVCMGPSEAVESFRSRWIARALSLCGELGLEGTIVPATDPFFAPTARGRELLQRLKGLKDELLLPLGDGRMTAGASFNHHETFFGSAFGIRLAEGSLTSSGCVAFGLERWTLAFMVAHGIDARGWPPIPIEDPESGATS